MDGRNTSAVGVEQIYLSKPRTNELSFFDWELIKLNDGTYNIKSYTSNMYLDGRHQGIGDGPHVGLSHLTSDRARTSSYFKWRIKKYQFGGKTRYAFQSVSSTLYLDGRNPNHIGGGQLYLTGRDPQGDTYLMWDLQ